MKHYTFIILFLLCILSKAQVPGYMGKRFVVIHNSFYGPALVSPSSKNTEGLSLNITKCLGVEYAASRRKSFCFAVQYYLTGVKYNRQIRYDENSTVPAKLSATHFSFGLKKFTRKNVAQIGFYIKLDLLYQQFKLNYDPEGFISYYGYNSAGSGRIKIQGIGTAFSIGKQRIFADKLVVDYGLRVSFNTLLFYNYLNPVEREMVYESYYRMLNHQFFNVNLGIGFLAF